MDSNTLNELDDDQWEAERNLMTQRFFQIDADEFISRFEKGDFEDDGSGLMQTLMLFPELL